MQEKEIDRRKLLGGAAAAIGLTAVAGLEAEAQERGALQEKRPEKVFGRSVRFVVTPVETVRALNVRTNEEVVEAQKTVTADMIKALEEMVNSAKAGRIEGQAALNLGAAAW